MVTIVPARPIAGENDAMLVTVKLDPLVPVTPFTITVMAPVVAPFGMEVVMEVAVLAVTVATVPLNASVLLAGIGSKSYPAIVTTVPTGPKTGLNVEIVGTGRGTTEKFPVLMDVKPFATTVIGPVVAPSGTVVVSVVSVLAITAAGAPS